MRSPPPPQRTPCQSIYLLWAHIIDLEDHGSCRPNCGPDGALSHEPTVTISATCSSAIAPAGALASVKPRGASVSIHHLP
jgi:hypothetical protein